MKLQINDVVKSLDFNGIADCFMIGRVVSIDEKFGTFKARTMFRVFEGKDVSDGEVCEFFTAPLQGNLFADNDKMLRVTVY
jgi:hypothetical protein